MRVDVGNQRPSFDATSLPVASEVTVISGHSSDCDQLGVVGRPLVARKDS